jgi:hypothetical protein
MTTPIPASTHQREMRGTDAAVIDLHRWQRAREADARQRSMATHPAGARRQLHRTAVIPGR